MAELVVRRLTLSTPVLLSPFDGSATLEGEIRDGDIRRRYVSIEKHLKVPVELDFERQEHVDHEIEQEPSLEHLVCRHRRVARNLSQELTVELILQRGVLQTRVDQVLYGAEVVLKRQRLHGSGEIEL